jgi:uncharacterized ion transporter superfamily protein YfcC
MKLAQLPSTSQGALRLVMFVVAFVLWIAWTMRHASKTRILVPRATSSPADGRPGQLSRKDIGIFVLVVSPMAAYVYGSIAAGWGFNELSAGFLIAGALAGLLGGLGVQGTTLAYLEGMQSLLPAALLIGVARSISLVLADGHVIDTILQGLATPLAHAPAAAAAILMIAAQGIVHVFVPSVSGQAVLTMPVFVPLSDLIGVSRQATVLAYQMGAGLMELLTPTNGALMAVLLAAGVPYQRWLRFALAGAGIVLLVGLVGIAMTMRA